MTQSKQPQNGGPRTAAREGKSQRTNEKSAPRLQASRSKTRIPRKPVLPRISSYAETLLSRKAAASGASPDENRKTEEEWITTSEAARLSGYSRRHIRNLCEQGFFAEREEWKQRRPCPGSRQGGIIRIHRDALKKLYDIEP